MKLAIVATHPVQYHAPWFRLLTAQKGLDLKIYFGLLPDAEEQGVGFGQAFQWDVPLLEGYIWEELPSSSKHPSLDGFFANSTPAVYDVLKRDRPELVILTGWQSLPLLQAYWACIRLKIPMIIRAEANALRQRKWWVRLLHKLYLGRLSAFLCIGKSNQQFYLDYGIDKHKLFNCPYFVDNQYFQQAYKNACDQRLALREHWQIPEEATCFIYVGKLIPKKRIMDLLLAFQLALESVSNIYLMVVGSGELMVEAKAFVKSNNLPVTFVGFLNQSELPKAYVAADCMVLPSDFGETWGLVVNEAMVCGLPAIVSDRVGCGPDLVEEGITGHVFPFGDIETLAKKMLDVASNSICRDKMGENAQHRIQGYSVEQAVEGTLQAIDLS